MIARNAAIILLIGSLGLISADESVSPQRPRECYSCTGINCQRTTKLNQTVSCTDILDICVTIFEDFSVVAKGCYLDMPDKLRAKCDDQNNPECFKCFGQMCNNKGRVDFKCVECNSSDNSKCATDTSAMTPVQCSAPTAPNSYCFVRSEGKVVNRGCFTYVQEQVECMNDEGCRMCLSSDGQACNGFNLDTPRSSATKTVASLSLVSLIVLAMRGMMQ